MTRLTVKMPSFLSSISLDRKLLWVDQRVESWIGSVRLATDLYSSQFLLPSVRECCWYSKYVSLLVKRHIRVFGGYDCKSCFRNNCSPDSSQSKWEIH